MTLSLCMIVRNEEQNIVSCLKSVAGFIDQMVMVDTGSTDATVRCCESFNASVFHYEFNDDFSAARNYSLSLATGDWILVLDADERLMPASALRSLLSAGPNLGGYYFQRDNYVLSDQVPAYHDYVVRLFRNLPAIRFQGRVHEKVDASILATGLTIGPAKISLQHYGTLKKYPALANRKFDQYSELLRRELVDRPNDPELLYLLGIEQFKHRDYAAAEQSFRRSRALQPLLVKSLNGLGLTLGESGNLIEARRVFEQCIVHEPYCGEHYYNLAAVLVKLGLLAEAHANLDEAAARGPTAEIYYTRALIHSQQQEPARAISACQAAVKFDYTHLKSYLLLIKLLMNQRDFSAALDYARAAAQVYPDDDTLKRTITLLVKMGTEVLKLH